MIDVGSGSEVMVRELSFFASKDRLVVKLCAPAASVCGVPFIVIVLVEEAAFAKVTSKVKFKLVVAP